MSEEESTYDSSANQPTNQPPTKEYLIPFSFIRLTCKHVRWPEIVAKLDDVEWYISYPHFGDAGNNEHFHLLLPGDSKTIVERYRKRFRPIVGTGNSNLAAVPGQNCITRTIAYCTHEKTTPFFRGDQCAEWIACAPNWIPKLEWFESSKKRKRDESEDDYSKPSKDKHYLLGYNNLVKQALRYRARFLAKFKEGKDLSFVLSHMYVNSDWRLSATILRQGIPKTLYVEYEAQVSRTMGAKFTPEYFNMMIRDDAHDNRDKW